jgi:sugar lactone lactonase YvrE
MEHLTAGRCAAGAALALSLTLAPACAPWYEDDRPVAFGDDAGPDGDGGAEAACASAACGGCGPRGVDCQGGACVGGVCQPVVLAATENGPLGIAVDDTRVYWTASTAGQVKFVSKGGGIPAALAVGLGSPSAIAVDAQRAYVTTLQPPEALLGVSLADGQATKLGSGMSGPFGVALDAQNVYWADATSAQVSRVAKSGGAPTAVATALDGPGAVAVAAQDVYIATSGGHVVRAPLAGGSPTTLASLPAQAVAIALDAQNVYATASDGGVRRIPKAGGLPTVLAWGRPVGIAVDAAGIYWANAGTSPIDGDGAIVMLPFGDAGAPLVLADHQWDARCVAVDDRSVYWTDDERGVVMKVAKP